MSVEILVGSADDEDTPVDTTPSGLTPDEVEDLTTTTTTTTTVPEPDDAAPGGAAADEETPADEPTAGVPATGSTLPETPAPGLTPGSTEVGEGDEAASTVADDAVTTDPITGAPVVTDPDTGQPVVTDPDTGLPIPVDTAPSTTLPPLAEKEFGLLFGNGRGRVPQVRFVQDNPSLAVLGIGDLVVTAGGSTSLSPPGIPIGRVINRVDRPGVGGPLLEVELEADVTRLNFVQVVIFRPLTEVGG